MKCRDVDLKEGYWVNGRGMALFSSIMKPSDGTRIRAVVFFCHGFLGSSSYLIRCEYQRLVKEGIAFVGIDYEGHGQSDGLQGLIPSWELLVNDSLEYFQETLKKEFPNKPYFLCGESMGGAVCFSIYQKTPQLWRGVVFQAPMCKIKEDMLPPPFVVKLFLAIVGKSDSNAFSELPIAPSKKSLLNDVFKSEEKRRLAKDSPLFYGDRKPRLASARELLRVSDTLSTSLKDFKAPFIVQHGLSDVVTDPSLSQALYDESPSKDKTIKLYEGMWHSINIGESDENLDIVFRDAIDWILKRS
ncbi:phospholipase [Thalassiosira pseudonana CCMP1335]|uniref:Phospholipase n=1 Tax=Thalassiosira pseudonana TaxID=35128 RepID=B8C3P0_THAPS|nr:phospholipase [Thalassiosira pseudonana CCMP1335]EED92153.1 phospholipase [Thalassiosira pseudonana CCMP1335]